MSRVTALDLTLDTYPWRSVPMPGANSEFALTRLDASGRTFALHGRFPAGFDRSEPGGYHDAEEFLVLDGELHLEGVRYQRGDLTFIPARYRRTSMWTSTGCTVLAWFGGPAIFHPAADLSGAVTTGITSVPLGTVSGEFLATDDARWSAATDPAARPGDFVNADLTRWQRLAGAPASGPGFVRTER